jgi:hypothetical protein
MRHRAITHTTVLAVLLAGALAMLILAPGASAASTICSSGSAAGQCLQPQGVAVDFETGHLYVADQGNNRIDVFESNGTFLMAFGWGVDTGADEFQTCTTASTCNAGIAGSGAGQFSAPSWIAVDNNVGSASRHDVYIGTDNFHVQKFTPSGEFTAAFGEEGQGPCQFARTDDPIAVGPGGDVYAADAAELTPNNFSNRIERFDPSGKCLGEVELFQGDFRIRNLAVDSSGNVYVTVIGAGGELRKYDPSGNLLEKLDEGIETEGLAVDPSDNLFAQQVENRAPSGSPFGFYDVITEYDSGGNHLIRFGYGMFKRELPGLAAYHSAGGDVFGSEGSFGVKYFATPSPGPIVVPEPCRAVPVGNTRATLNARVNPEGQATTYRYQYVDKKSFEAEGGFASPNTKETPEIPLPPHSISEEENEEEAGESGEVDEKRAPFELHQASAEASLVPETEYHCRVIATNADAPAGIAGEEGTFSSRAPLEIGATWTSGIDTEAATLNAEVNPLGIPTTGYFEYVEESVYQAEAANEKQAIALSGASGGSFTLGFEAEVSAPLAFNADAGSVQAALAALKSIGGGGNVSVSGSPGGPYSVEFTGALGDRNVPQLSVDASALTPPGAAAATSTASDGNDGFDHAHKAPDTEAGEEAIDLGAGESFKIGTEQISGLKAGTAYRYRVVATDPFFPDGFPGRTQAFRTFHPGEGGLPDGRAYELVSPAKKNSAEVAVPSKAGGLSDNFNLRIQAAAGSGEAITYTSWTPFGNPESAPGASQYLAKRDAGGWSTENISPFGFQHNPFRLPYRGFSADLHFAGVVVSEPPCGEGAVAGVESLCLRDDETGQQQALTLDSPAVAVDSNEPFCTEYAGTSADGRHVVFAANGAMAGAPAGKGFSLYEWSAEGGLALVSVLPDNTPAPPADGTGAGAQGNSCAIDQQIVRHAVSADGSVVFWTYGGKYLSSERPLFARIDGTETVQLDAKVPGEKNGGKGEFWAASADGSKALFSAPGKLTSSAKAAGELYRYDTTARTLTDLTPGAIAPEIEGVIGASEDETYAYFVGKGALTGEEENAAGEKAEAGANNLYLYHEGEGVRFIGALSGLDEGAWDSAPGGLSARVTPDGRNLAFTSIEAEKLTATKGLPGSGYDNAIASGEHCEAAAENTLTGGSLCAEAFLYSAEANMLTCVSCNPTGARPAGPAALPTWTNPFEGPRYLSDDGSWLFFESRDALSTADENGKRDVYEFERAGAGSCGTESPSFDLSSGGCLSLISSGRSSDESYLLDASSDGRDVFFSTRQSLLGSDVNENYDVYDARAPHVPGEAVAFPEPVQRPPCEGEEACKPPAGAPPSASTAATPHFQGPGNTVEKKKHKKKKHKSKKKKSGASKKKKSGANHKRKAGR